MPMHKTTILFWIAVSLTVIWLPLFISACAIAAQAGPYTPGGLIFGLIWPSLTLAVLCAGCLLIWIKGWNKNPVYYWVCLMAVAIYSAVILLDVAVTSGSFTGNAAASSYTAFCIIWMFVGAAYVALSFLWRDDALTATPVLPSAVARLTHGQAAVPPPADGATQAPASASMQQSVAPVTPAQPQNKKD